MLRPPLEYSWVHRSKDAVMTAEQPDNGPLSRRSFVHGALMTTVAAALVPAGLVVPVSARAHSDGAIEELFRQLDRKILDAMEEFVIPGVAVGVLHRGREYGSRPPARRSPAQRQC